MDREQAAYDELRFYTLAHPDPSFIHQHVVDAHAAACADADTKPITLAFALIGLHLFLDEGYTGRQVQQMHMRLGKTRRPWPTFALPEDRGAITVHDVLAKPPGADMDAAIRAWCASVWRAYGAHHESVAALIAEAFA